MPPATSPSFPSLVGRNREQSELRQLLPNLEEGQGQLVLIAGEAGIGKTTLVRDLIERAETRGFRTFSGACYDLETTPPYGPWLNTNVLDISESEQPPVDEARSLTPERQRILDFLAENGPSRPADVAAELGLSPNAANQALRRLLQDSLVNQPSYGQYMVSNDAPSERPAGAPLVQQLYNHQQHIEGGTQQALFRQVWDVLTAQCRRLPVVLVLEDLHWADQASIELLRFVARQIRDVPMLLVVTYRDVDLTVRHPLYRLLPYIVREGHAIRINLLRLKAPAISELVERRYNLAAGDAVRLVDYLRKQTEGNPFFMEEVLLSLESHGTLYSDGEQWFLRELTDVAVPLLVRQVIDGRLEQLDDRAHELLQQAAVIGAMVPLDLWQQVSQASDDELIGCIDQALHAQLLSESTSLDLRFRHALIRDALYAQVLPLRRRVWHLRIANTLTAQSDPDPAAVAYHFEHANDARAVDWHAKAGDRARELYAPEAAVGHYTSALDCGTRAGASAPLNVMHHRGLSLMTVGNFDAARQDFEDVLQAAQSARDDIMVWHVLADLGALWGERNYARAGAYLSQALDLARQIEDRGMLATSLNRLGNWHLNLQEMDHSLELYQEALEIFNRMDDSVGRASTYDLLAMGKALRGDLNDAEMYARLALDEYRRINDRQGDAQALSHLTLCAVLSVHDPLVPASIGSDEARRAGIQSVNIAGEIGWRAGEAYCLLILGLFEISRSRPSAALRHARAGLEIAEAIQHRQWQALAHNALARIYHDVLDYQKAREHAEREFRLGREVNSKIWTLRASADQAMSLIGLSDLDEAARVLDEVFPEDEPGLSAEQLYCQYARASVLQARGEFDRALRLIQRMETSIPRWSPVAVSPRLASLKGRVLASLERFDEAMVALDSARAVFEAHDALGLLWRTDVDRSRLHHRLGNEAEAEAARNAVMQAVRTVSLEIDEEHTATDFVDEVRRMLGMGESDQGTAASIGLSERQIEVLRLVAQGLTDAEIGERLFISTRTVNGHLQSIFNKLGISSRTAATAFAYERGLIEPTPR